MYTVYIYMCIYKKIKYIYIIKRIYVYVNMLYYVNINRLERLSAIPSSSKLRLIDTWNFQLLIPFWMVGPSA